MRLLTTISMIFAIVFALQSCGGQKEETSPMVTLEILGHRGRDEGRGVAFLKYDYGDTVIVYKKGSLLPWGRDRYWHAMNGSIEKHLYDRLKISPERVGFNDSPLYALGIIKDMPDSVKAGLMPAIR